MAKYRITPSSKAIIQLPISIGHKAEKGVEAIEFDLTAWVETYGSGTLTVIMRRWGDAIPYPVALEIDENNKATWTLSDIDTAKAGMAYAQLSYIVGNEVVKKSDIYTFRVMDSLTGEGEPPEAYESWLEHLQHLAAEAMAEVLDIEGVATDKTLTVDGGIADAKATGDALSALEDQFGEETDKLKADLGVQVTALRDYNVYDNLLMHAPIEKRKSGITWTPNADHSVAVSGTASSTSLNDLFFSVDSIPDWVAPGETYHVKYQASVVKFRVCVYVDNDTTNYINILSTISDAEFTVPLNITGMIIRYAVSSGETVNETVKAEIPSAETNAHLTAQLNAMIGNENISLDTGRWIIGSITTSGVYTSDTKRICTISGVDVSHLLGVSIVVDDGFKCALVWYGDNGVFLRDDYWVTGSHTVKKPDGAVMLRMVASDINDGTADIGYSAHVHISGVYYNQTSAKNLALTVGKLASFDFANYVGYFNRGAIDNKTTPISVNGASSVNIRRTAIIPVAEPYQLEMTSADYLFRLYWKDENDAVHSTGWARSWLLPVNDYVGVTIKRADEKAFDVDERAELHFAPFGTPKDYFKNEIESVTSRIKAANTEPSLCFLLSTDQHTMAVQGTLLKYDTISDMVVNMRELAKRINFDANISLGDIADYKVGDSDHFTTYGILDNTDYTALDGVFYQWMDDAMNKLASVHPNFIYIPGNHDDNRYLNKDVIHDSTSAYDFSPGEMYSYYAQRSQLRRVPNMDNNGLDYYVDFPDFKIRMFCLDSNHYYDAEHTSPHGYHNCWWYGFQDATVSWMREQLSQIPSEWSVLLLSHMSPVKANNVDNTAYINMEAMQQVIQDFIDGGGSYIATLYGHSHIDWSTTIPWLEIAFNCQKCENKSTIPENMPGAVCPTRTIGTATEDSWNVVMIQPGSRKINVIRFGAGDDRTFNY